jgi:hypothetical protein
MDVRMSIVFVSSLYLGACAAEAQLVKRGAHGGELLLHGPAAGAALEARNLIVELCGGRFLVVDESRALAPANNLSGRGRVSYVAQTKPALRRTAEEDSALSLRLASHTR